MIDTAQGRAVTYRNVQLNNAAPVAPGSSLIVGTQIESFVFHPVQGFGFTEKRARADGLDAVDVYLGGRRLSITGSTYGETRGDAFDRMEAVVAALTPTLSYAEDPDLKGYLPFYFKRSTANVADFPSGVIDLFSNMRPLAVPEVRGSRDSTGGADAKGLGFQWAATLEAIDPRLYVNELIEHVFTEAEATLANRGNYPTPLTVIASIPFDTVSWFRLVGNGSDLTLTPDMLGDPELQVLTWDGLRKVLLRTKDGQTTLRMDLATFDAANQKPMVQPGGSDYEADALEGLDTDATLTVSYHEAFI